MSSFKIADRTLLDLASEVMVQFPEHKPLLDARVKIDFLYAYATEDGGDALTKNGRKALGIARKTNPRERAKGNGDAEIAIDAEWWGAACIEERKALLDHEIYHLEVCDGKRDDIGRPVLRLRKHDLEFGWFNLIARRHGEFSLERIQAAEIRERFGQTFWPEIADVNV